MFGLVSWKKVLEEKEKQIDILKQENTHLKAIVNCYTAPQLNPVNIEENKMLEGSLNNINFPSESELKSMAEAEKEASYMLMGEHIEV